MYKQDPSKPEGHKKLWRTIGIAAAVLIVIIIIIIVVLVSTKPSLAVYADTRLPGAGYISGSDADQLSTPKSYAYPASSQQCQSDCNTNAECQEFVSDGFTCWLMNKKPVIPQTFSTGQDVRWMSGVKQ